MTELANKFLSHVLARAEALCHETEGCTVTNEGEHVTITTPAQVAHVNFYELDPGMPEVVELNSAPANDPDNPTFFLHFKMYNLTHAEKLLGELLDTIGQGAKSEATRILLSCTSGLTYELLCEEARRGGGYTLARLRVRGTAHRQGP